MTDFILEKNSYYSQNFKELNLSSQTLRSIEFEDCSFTECNFSNATFDQCQFVDCTFTKCNLSLVKLAFSQFNDVSFKSSKVIGIDWTKAHWPNLALFSPISFEQCTINDCSFFDLELKELSLDSCKHMR